MPDALYWPYSRCLNDVALKRAVLLYDRLLFVDPVDPVARAELYTREAAASGADPEISQRWRDASASYDLLHQRGVVDTVDQTAVRDPEILDAFVDGGLRLDLDTNDAAGLLFARRRGWQML